jgi:hypothetical protein
MGGRTWGSLTALVFWLVLTLGLVSDFQRSAGSLAIVLVISLTILAVIVIFIRWPRKPSEKQHHVRVSPPRQRQIIVQKDDTLAYTPLMCPKCNHPNLPHVKYCAECGQKLVEKNS